MSCNYTYVLVLVTFFKQCRHRDVKYLNPSSMFFNIGESMLLTLSWDKNPISNSLWHTCRYSHVSLVASASAGCGTWLLRLVLAASEVKSCTCAVKEQIYQHDFSWRNIELSPRIPYNMDLLQTWNHPLFSTTNFPLVHGNNRIPPKHHSVGHIGTVLFYYFLKKRDCWSYFWALQIKKIR